jgi:hypothetical protein
MPVSAKMILLISLIKTFDQEGVIAITDLRKTAPHQAQHPLSAALMNLMSATCVTCVTARPERCL